MLKKITSKAYVLFINWLRRPFPRPTDFVAKSKISLIVSILVFMILMAFKPFGIHRMHNNAIWLISGFSSITLLVMQLSTLLLPTLFRKFFNPATWTIGKYLLHILLDYILISLFSWGLTISLVNITIEADSILTFFLLTFAVAFFPVFTIVYVHERVLISNKLKNAVFLTEQLKRLKPDTKSTDGLILETGVKTPALKLETNQILCAMAKGNYALVYYFQENETRHVLLRISLSTLEKKLKHKSYIIRCHRSALVNLNHIEKFSGNARNYFLILKGEGLRIDISRNIPHEILNLLRNI